MNKVTTEHIKVEYRLDAMSQRKNCSYKGCSSKHIPGVPSDITFFQFPRDADRFKLWMRLSRCENKDAPVKYLCSKHFDERKYISKNPRRLLLLANAVPYSYESDSEDIDNDIDGDIDDEDQIQVVTSQFGEDILSKDVDVVEYNESVCYDAESTINDIEFVQEEHSTKSYDYLSKKRKWEPQTEIVETDELNTNEDLHEDKTRRESKSTLEVENKTQKQRASVEARLENVTTFIFKGEEYIQMPKEVYIAERNELLNSIQYYKEIVMNIKSQIDIVKL